MSSPVADLANVGDDPDGILSSLARARPLGIHAPRPEDLMLTFEAGRPGAVVLTQLWYPRWRARLAGTSGETDVPIHRVFDGAQAIDVPAAGSWTVRMSYDTTPDRVAAWAARGWHGRFGVCSTGGRGGGWRCGTIPAG